MKTRMQKFSEIDIYPVISSEFCLGRPPVEILEAIGRGGARIVQMREKIKSDRELFSLALEFRKLCSRYGMLFIVNDRLDIALASGADGIHLGQDDMPVESIKAVAPELIVGVSTHNLSEALEAQKDGADYINIGPIFPTATKSVPCPALGIDKLQEISAKIRIPFTVMGGIKKHNFPELIRIGATRLAMVTEITAAENVAEKVRELRKFHADIQIKSSSGRILIPR